MSFFASSHQVPTMHPRTVPSARVNVSNSYQTSAPMRDKWNPDKFGPVPGDPEKVRPLGPQELARSKPQRTSVSVLPQARPSPQTRLPSSSSKSMLAQVPGTPVDTAATLPPMYTSSLSITQQSPVPGPSPGPPNLNMLRSPRSVPALVGACRWTS